MLPSVKPRYALDGKNVYAWLFARQIKMPNGRQIPDMVQVEAFTLDHAWQRLQKRPGFGRRSDWEMIAELEPEHDVGYLGQKMPLLPKVVLLDTPKRSAHDV